MDKCFCHFNGYQVKDATARADIEKLKLSISAPAFSLDNVVCIGDSFLDGCLSGGELSNYGRNLHGWGRYLEDAARAENPNAVFRYAHSEGGSGFNTAGEFGNTFMGQIMNHRQDMTDAEALAVKTVIIVGGVNDVNAGRIITIWDTVNAAREYFPNAKIVVAMSPIVTMIHTYNFYQLRYPTHDPRVCILTDSWRFLLADSKTRGDDGLHPTILGYQRFAAYLYYASKGMRVESCFQYQKEFSGVWGSVLVNFYKAEGTLTISVVGTINEGSVGFIEIGSRPYWMRKPGDAWHEVIVPIWSSVSGVALQFVENKFKIIMPDHTGAATINGSVCIGLDVL